MSKSEVDSDDNINCSQSFSKISINSGFSITVSAPGKVILHGEHSVVYGKLALAASLGLRTKLSFEELPLAETTSNFINVNLHAVNLVHCYALNDIQKHLLGEQVPIIKNGTNYSIEKPEVINQEILLQRVENFIKMNCGSVPLSTNQHQALSSFLYLFVAIVGSLDVPLLPFAVSITTDLTVGAGLGSSASFLVVVSAALIQYAKFKCHKFENSTAMHTLDKKDLELISKWAYSAEKIIHGTPSGVDNTVCTFGNMVEYRKGAPPKSVKLLAKLRVLLINTKVPKDTKTLVARVSTLRQKYSVIVDGIMDAMDGIAVAALQNLMKLNDTTSSDKLKLDTCQKIVLEIYKELGMLSNLNQNLLKSLGVSHEALDQICAMIHEDGLDGKLTGAGGGGYAIAIIPPNYNATALTKVRTRLDTQGFESVVVELGGPGVVVHKML